MTEHPHGSLVEQVHRVITTDQGTDAWTIAESIVEVVARRAREGVGDDAFLAELTAEMTRPLGTNAPGRPVSIAEHIEEAERLLAFAYSDNDPENAPGGYYVDDDHCNAQVRAAEVHARIAHAAAAAALIRPPREPDPEGSPGAVLIERLTDVLERLAVALEPGPPVRGRRVD